MILVILRSARTLTSIAHSRQMRLLGFPAFFAMFFAPSTAHAGMPFVRLTELGRMRLEAISFFAVLILLLTLLIQWLWNDEPGIYGKMRMVLLRSSEVATLDIEEINSRIDTFEKSKYTP